MATYPDHYLTAISILLAILFFALPLAYWPYLFEAASLPRYFLIAVIASTTLLLWSISGGSRQIIWHPAFALILGFLGWAAISTSWSPDPGTSLIEIMQLSGMILLAFMAMQLSVSTTFIKLVIAAILAGAALVAMIGIGQYFGFNPFEFRKNGNSIPATFINPNHAAMYFDFIPWLALVSVFVFQRPAIRWLAAASLGLTLAFLLVNTSRGSLLALFITSLIFLIALVFKPDLRRWIKSRLSARYKEFLLALLIPLVTLAPLPQGQVVEQWDTTILEGTVDLSSQSRFAMYLNSLPAIYEHPFTGLGYGGMRVGFLPYSSSIKPVGFRTVDTVLKELHSDPLQYFVELGLPGGILAIVIFLSLLRSGWRTINHSSTPETSVLCLGFWLGLIACGVHASLDFPLRLATSAAMFWLFAGFLLGMDAPRHSRLSGKSLRPLLSIIGVGGILFSLFFYKAYLTANHELYNTLLNLQKGKCVAATQASERGLAAFSSEFMLLTAHAQVYSRCSFPPPQKLAAMNRVLLLDPTNLRARLTRGDLYNKANYPELAIPDFETLAYALPHRPQAYAGLGDSARLQGHRLKARHYYMAALKRKPDYKYAQNKLDEMAAEVEK